MAFLNSGNVTIDAILTRKGRELLASGDFKITQFACFDDDVDYTLYNPNHPSGSAFYGEAIEKLPVNEAYPDETQVAKYKLVTLPRGTSKLPVISVGYANIALKQGASLAITPQTLNYLGSVSTYEPSGYLVTIGDARVMATFTGVGVDTTDLGNLLNSSTGTNISKSQIGTSFTLTGTTIDTLFGSTATSLKTVITVIGRDSGARITIPVSITKK